jgi:hypothetical protein
VGQSITAARRRCGSLVVRDYPQLPIPALDDIVTSAP